MDPFPPRRIWLATGQPDGMYDVFGHEYQRRLAREGLRVEFQRSAGSLENLERLLRGQVDVAFVQGGTYQLVPDPKGRLRGMAAVYREPLWIFYRGKPVTDGLASLAGRRLALGAPGSGTEAISQALLGALGLPTTGPNLLSLPAAEARQRLEEGRIDAAFFVSSYRDRNVTALLRRPDVRLLGFTREVAFARNCRYLSPVRIAEGLLDLKADLPREEITLMAPAALLVCRETLHPRVVEQLLTFGRDVHGAGSLLDPPRTFPSREGVDVPLHEHPGRFPVSALRRPAAARHKGGQSLRVFRAGRGGRTSRSSIEGLVTFSARRMKEVGHETDRPHGSRRTRKAGNPRVARSDTGRRRPAHPREGQRH